MHRDVDRAPPSRCGDASVHNLTSSNNAIGDRREVFAISLNADRAPVHLNDYAFSLVSNRNAIAHVKWLFKPDRNARKDVR